MTSCSRHLDALSQKCPKTIQHNKTIPTDFSSMDDCLASTTTTSTQAIRFLVTHDKQKKKFSIQSVFQSKLNENGERTR